MSYLNQIQHSLDYVEGHRTEPLTVEDLASQIGFSPYHYYRIFGAYVGIPVMEYVRRRRKIPYPCQRPSTKTYQID
ncbi:MAG TPA: hypothetical protein DDZ66_08395 [Firmicutes bacterium]|nr:hypothetical protein [Bacillota bacterium]